MRPTHAAAEPDDCDPGETREWLESLEGMIQHVGAMRAAYVMKKLQTRARELGVATQVAPFSAYQNTISGAAAHPPR